MNQESIMTSLLVLSSCFLPLSPLASLRQRRRTLVCPTRAPPRHDAPRAVLVPPAVALISCTALAAHPLVPSSIRGCPTAFLLSALLTNAGLVPAAAPLYDFVLSAVAPAAVGMLLLVKPSSTSTDPAQLMRLGLAFAVGAVGTILGAVVAALLVPIAQSVRWKLAAAFVGTYVGGTVNYVGVATATGLPPDVTAAGLAADLAVMAAYMAGLFSLAAQKCATDSPLKVSRPELPRADSPSPTQNTSFTPLDVVETAVSVNSAPAAATSIPLTNVPRALQTNIRNIRGALLPALTIAIIFKASRAIVTRFALPPGADMLLITTASIGVSALPRSSQALAGSSRLASIALSIFFAALGATTRISSILASSPKVLLFATIVLTVHAVVLRIIGRAVLRIPVSELLLSSNANVGGPSTAAAFAASMGWSRLVPAAVLLGTVGYVVGTPLALSLFSMVRAYGSAGAR